MKTVKIVVYRSAAGSGWLCCITNQNYDQLIIHQGREAECKDFAAKLFNRPLEWKEDPKDGLGYFDANIEVRR